MNAEQKYHHPFSPSTLQALEACPCYEGTQTEHPRALAGTRAHKVTETLVDDNLLSDDDAEAAAECLDFYNQRRQLMTEARETARYTAPLSEPFFEISELSETYLPIDDEVFADGVQATTAGYFDRAIINHTGTYAEMFDWKFGNWKITECENNLQAAAYVLGLFKKFPKLEKIQFFFKQPALNLVSSHTFERKDIPQLYLRIKVVVARARRARVDGDFSTARSSVPVCLFCRHISACPKVADLALKVGKKFAPLQVPESVTPSMVQDPEQTGLAMKLAQVLGVWSDAIKATTADRVLRGAPLPEGYRLVSREGSRKVTDPVAFKTIALEILSEEELESTKKISLGAVETAIGHKMPRGEKKAAIQKFKSDIEAANAVEKGNGAVFLQADND